MKTEKTDLPPISKRSWGIAAVTGAGAFMAMLDSTVTNLGLESIRAELSSTLSLVQWVMTGYLYALAVSLPAAAWLGARFGYGRVWAFSLTVFIAASVLCAIAPGSSTLIGARLLQGLAGGLMIPSGQAVIGSTVDKRQLGRIFGLLGFVIALGPALGPVLGGFLLDHTSWRWLFWLNVPVGLTALIAARGLVPGGTADSNRALDKKGMMLLGTGLPLLLYSATEIGLAESTPSVIFTLLLSVALISTYGFTALKKSNPLIDLRLLKRRPFFIATITIGLTGANMYGGLLVIPLYLQLAADQGPVETGLWLLVIGLGSAFTLPLAGILTDRIGAGIVILGGACLLLLSTIPLLSPEVPSLMILGAIFTARGAGIALAQMPAMTAAYSSVARTEMGDASTLVNIIQRIGGAFGAVGVVAILQKTGGSSSTNAYIWAFAALSVISIMTIISAMLMSRKPEFETTL